MKSKKQDTVALSTCEAEYMASAPDVQEAKLLSMLVKDFVSQPYKPIIIQGDNQAAIALVKNPIVYNRSKHIDIKYHSWKIPKWFYWNNIRPFGIKYSWYDDKTVYKNKIGTFQWYVWYSMSICCTTLICTVHIFLARHMLVYINDFILK